MNLPPSIELINFPNGKLSDPQTLAFRIDRTLASRVKQNLSEPQQCAKQTGFVADRRFLNICNSRIKIDLRHFAFSVCGNFFDVAARNFLRLQDGGT